MRKTLNQSIEEFAAFLKQYSSFDDFTAQRTQAEADIQSDIREDVESQMWQRLYIDGAPKGMDVTIEDEGFIDWLFDNYRLESK